MIAIRTMIAVAVLTLLAAQAVAQESPRAAAEVGAEAPDFTLATHDGRSLTLSKLEGKRGVVLVFFATWCPSCMAEVPRVKEFVRATRDEPVLVYGVNYKQPKRVVDRFVREHRVNYRVLLDIEGGAARKYNVRGIPLIVGVDAEGIVRYRAHHLPREVGGLVRKLTALLKGKT